MDPAESQVEPAKEAIAAEATVRPRASDWLWHPWYAKLWWLAIPIYWLGAAASLKIPMLAGFYESALAGLLNVLFFPITALMVLGVGYVRGLFEPIDWSKLEPADPSDRRFYRPRIDPHTDPTDPRSGIIWIGHPRNHARLHGDD